MKVSTLKKSTILLIIVFSLALQHKVKAIDYQQIMKHADNTPKSVKNSTQKLSNYLCSPYKTDKEKIASIYYWVAKNISYNDEQAKKAIFYENVKELIDQVMKSKSGVCQHFSELTAELGRISGLEVYVVNGYTRTDEKVDDLSHAWNIIKISGQWYFLDATWAGAALKTVSKNKFPLEFFLMSPEKDIERRMPFDPIWQALSGPIKYHEFDKGKMKPEKKGNFNFNDSINLYNRQTLIEKQRATMLRMKSNGNFNALLRREYDLMESNYNMLLSNIEVEKYNQGTGFYNKGMGSYNQYVKIKNNKSSYSKYNKKQLFDILDTVELSLDKAKNQFIQVKTNNTEMSGNIKKSMINIKKISELITKEKKFVKDNFK